MAAGPTPITITVTSAGGAGTILTPDYTAELAKVTAEVSKLTATVVKMNISLATLAASLVAIEAILVAVQTPTGDFRTKEVGVTTDNILVNTALTKSAIPPPPNTGI
jgi:hypothetical protein